MFAFKFYVCLSVGLVLYVVVFLLCVLNSLLFDVRSLCLLEMIMLVVSCSNWCGVVLIKFFVWLFIWEVQQSFIYLFIFF